MTTQTGYADSSHGIDAADTGSADASAVDAGHADLATDGRAEADGVGLDPDKIHHLLQNERRRNVLRYLRGVEGPVQMRDIAEQVAAWEHDTTVAQLMSDQRQRVYIALYQSHLPKFDEEGIIDYNQSRGIVEKRPAAAELMQYLDGASEDQDTDVDEPDTAWELYYLGASGGGALALASAGLGMAPFGGVSDILVAALVLAMFTALTVAQIVTTADQ
jgi:hypothetical protein